MIIDHGAPLSGSAGKVLWHTTMSLDGFIAAPGDGLDWAFRHPGPNPLRAEIIRTTGAVLVGRRSYDVGQRAERPEMRKVYGGAWTGAEFVLTHRAPPPNPSVTFLAGDIRGAVETALGAANGKHLVLIGADVARQSLAAGLVDEIAVHIVPVLLGDGVRFFSCPGGSPVDLMTLSVTRSGELTNVRYRVGRETGPGGGRGVS